MARHTISEYKAALEQVVDENQRLRQLAAFQAQAGSRTVMVSLTYEPVSKQMQLVFTLPHLLKEDEATIGAKLFAAMVTIFHGPRPTADAVLTDTRSTQDIEQRFTTPDPATEG